MHTFGLRPRSSLEPVSPLLKCFMSEQIQLGGPRRILLIHFYLTAVLDACSLSKWRYYRPGNRLIPHGAVTRMACSSTTIQYIPKSVSYFPHLGRRDRVRKGLQARAHAGLASSLLFGAVGHWVPPSLNHTILIASLARALTKFPPLC